VVGSGAINLWTARTHLADVVSGDMAAVSGCFPNALIFKNNRSGCRSPRPTTAGVEVACATELVQVEEPPDHVRARFRPRR
jgi:hypothetical protein